MLYENMQTICIIIKSVYHLLNPKTALTYRCKFCCFKKFNVKEGKLFETETTSVLYFCYPHASEASREVANFNERKNPHTPYMVSKNLSVCLSVCLSVINFDPNYLRTG